METNNTDFDITKYDLSELPEDKKLELIKEFTESTAKHALQLFMALGLKTHIETMIVNDATKEEFILSFRKLGSGLPLVSPMELERANTMIDRLEEQNRFQLMALEQAYDLAKCGWYHNHPHNDITESLNLAPMLKILNKL